MKTLSVLATLLLATAVSSSAFAAPKKKKPAPPPVQQEEDTDTTDETMTTNETGFELGGHTGFAIPLGNVSKDVGPPDLNKYIAVAIPFAIDAGYRVTPNIYIGGFFHFAYAPTSSEFCASVQGDCSSSGTQLKFGPTLRYTFSPQRRFSPWVGAGAAYEVVNLYRTQGQQNQSYSVKGWEFFRAEVGVDYHAAQDIVVGPFSSFGIGQYFSQDSTGANGQSSSADYKNTSLHEWLTFGVRAAYNF